MLVDFLDNRADIIILLGGIASIFALFFLVGTLLFLWNAQKQRHLLELAAKLNVLVRRNYEFVGLIRFNFSTEQKSKIDSKDDSGISVTEVEELLNWFQGSYAGSPVGQYRLAYNELSCFKYELNSALRHYNMLSVNVTFGFASYVDEKISEEIASLVNLLIDLKEKMLEKGAENVGYTKAYLLNDYPTIIFARDRNGDFQEDVNRYLLELVDDLKLVLR